MSVARGAELPNAMEASPTRPAPPFREFRAAVPAERRAAVRAAPFRAAPIRASGRMAGGDAGRAAVALTVRSALGDRLGVCLSGLCILHCALTPVALLILPSLNVAAQLPGRTAGQLAGASAARRVGASFLSDDFHVAIAFLIAGAALLAFVPGYRAHRNPRVFAWAAPGFALIVLAAALGGETLGVYGEAGMSIVGSCALIRAHLLNREYCACCRTH